MPNKAIPLSPWTPLAGDKIIESPWATWVKWAPGMDTDVDTDFAFVIP